jgi:RHS repeat-associated protein
MIDNAYDDSGAIETITQGSVSTGIAYDDAGRPDRLTLPGGWTQDPTYDDAGQVTFIGYRHNDSPKGTLAYSYDAAGRIAAVTGSFARVGLPEPRSGLTYDDANRLTATGSTALQYDRDGNLTNDGTTTYSWNARGQLAGLTRGGLTASFGYGPEGDRIRRTVGGTATDYLNRGPMPAREQRGGAATGLLSGGVDEWFHRAEPGGGRTYLTDVLGSTVALGDAAGAVRTQYGYEPFGATTVVDDATQNAFTYTGREDDGTGLMYYRARYYSPTLQRFISEDPIGPAGGTNLYAYAADSPTNYTDPSGNNPVLGGCITGGLVEGVMSMAGQRLAGRKVDWGWGGVGGAAAMGCAFGAVAGLAALGGRATTASCLVNSFAAGTLVQMADGTRKPIEEVHPGERVLATPDRDANGDRRAGRAVETVISGEGDKRLVDLTIDGSVVTATDGHPFWLPQEDRWATAGELRVGQWLRTAAGTYVQIDSVAYRSDHQTVYNLAVEEDHTYYVLAGDAAVLVHNCSPSSALAANMEAAGVARPAETAAHHIVAASSPRAAAARRALKGAGIGINDARNGVYLPRNSWSANPTGASVHSRIHTDEYYAYVNDLMSGVQRGDHRRATAVLNRIRRELLAGQWP